MMCLCLKPGNQKEPGPWSGQRGHGWWVKVKPRLLLYLSKGMGCLSTARGVYRLYSSKGAV